MEGHHELARITSKFVQVLVFLGVKIVVFFWIEGHRELVRIALKVC